MFFMQPRVREADRRVRSKEYFGPQVASIFIRWSKSKGWICITRMSYVNEKIQLRTCSWEHWFKKKKTEVLHQPKPRSPYVAPNIHIDEHPLEWYKNSHTLEASSRTIEHRQKMLRMRCPKLEAHFLVCKNEYVKTILFDSPKILVYRAVVINTLLYGIEAWVLWRDKSNPKISITKVNAASAPSWTLDGRKHKNRIQQDLPSCALDVLEPAYRE